MAKAKWTPHKKAKAIDMYIAGEDTKDIAKAIGMHINTVRVFLQTTQKAMANMSATKSANSGGTNQWNPQGELRLQNPELINKDFQELLSLPDEENLTQPELTFCHIYVATNNYETAAELSGMDRGLFTIKQLKGGKGQSKHKEDGWLACLKMRVAYLRMKPNVSKKIEELRKTDHFDTDRVNKQFLQKQIMIQIDALAGSSSADSEKLKRDYIQMLGRTFGGFTEKVEIGMIDHKKSVRKLGQIIESDTLEELRAKKEAEKLSNGVD